jgi:shikimate dehydrogenase
VITGRTQLLGVIGDPIAHSLSPVIHNAALAAMQQQQPQLDYVYLPLPVLPQDLSEAIAGFTAIGLQGFNVTLPHKQAILPYLSYVSAIAQTVGAVNTVWRTEQGWAGTNTDVPGFLAPLSEYGRDWQRSATLILGCGGSARAVAVACAQLGSAEIMVVGRNQLKLQQFKLQLTQLQPSQLQPAQQSWPGAINSLQVYPWEALPELLPRVELVVNCTPLGMHPHGDQSPLTASELRALSPEAIVYDLIYTPRPTKLLVQARQRGLVGVDGLEMLVQQGAAALEIWLKQPVPVGIMRQAAELFLQPC